MGNGKYNNFYNMTFQPCAKPWNQYAKMEIPVHSIIGAQDIRQGTILCDFISIADVYRSVGSRARASYQSVSDSSALLFDQVTTNVVTSPTCCNSLRPSPFVSGRFYPRPALRFAAVRPWLRELTLSGLSCRSPSEIQRPLHSPLDSGFEAIVVCRRGLLSLAAGRT